MSGHRAGSRAASRWAAGMWRSTVLTGIVIAICGSPISARSRSGLESLPARDIAGCRLPGAETIGSVDVAIAIDTSRSTAGPSGLDINGNGRVGEFELSSTTDPGDSWLAVEVAGIRSLLRDAAELDVRFSIVTFSGSYDPTPQHPPKHLVRDCDAAVRSELTGNIGALEGSLERVLERGSAGYTNFAAGMRQAVRTLADEPPSPRATRRFVLFISDSTNPIRIGGDERIRRLDPVMAEVARKAIRDRIVFNTFGIGAVTGATLPHILSRIATATGGRYRAVEDPANLGCHLLNSLALGTGEAGRGPIH